MRWIWSVRAFGVVGGLGSVAAVLPVAVGVLAVTVAASSAAPKMLSTTSLLRVAFDSPSRGVGLFQLMRYPASGAGPESCELYVRPTDDGGASFGAAGAAVARTACESTAGISAIVLDRAGELIAYGPQLKVSRDLGRRWTAPRLPGSVAGLAVGDQAVWAIATRCRVGEQSCVLTLFESTNGGSVWRLAADQPPDRAIASPVALAGESATTTLLAVTASGGVVLALPNRPHEATQPRQTATVERSGSDATGWTSSTAACSAVYTSELAVAPDGSVWLACADEPAAGTQPKSLTRSLDGGQTWAAIWPACVLSGARCEEAMPLGGYLDGLVALSSQTAFYVGDRSSLTATHNGGASWRAVPGFSGQSSGTSQVTFFDARDGWAIDGGLGGYSALWRTRDGGTTWTRA